MIKSNKTNEESKLSNQSINLKSLVQMLKASSYSSDDKFSLRTLIGNNLTIKNQKSTNFCWAFAAMSSLETNLAMENYSNKMEEIIYDYSERHTVYSMTQSFLEGQTNSKGWEYEAKNGGNFIMATSYLTNGSGAIDESDMEFVDSEDAIDISNIQNKTVQTTVNDIRYFDSMYITKNDGIVDLNKNSLTETQLATLQSEMKEHISTNGSIYAGIYMPALDDTTNMNMKTGAIFCAVESFSGAAQTNHAVSVIGWDDEYDKNNFATTPSTDGAWIIRNSYGATEEVSMAELRDSYTEKTDEEIIEAYSKYFNCTLSEDGETLKIAMGDDGIFYVSYEDAYIYSNLMGIEDANDEVTYDNLYQYDYLGGSNAIYLKDSKQYDTYLANVFSRTTSDTEYLTSIGFESLTEGTYEVYINPNGSDKSLESLQKAELTTGDNITLTAGYHTINLKNAYELKGKNFAIVIRIKHTSDEYSYFTYETANQNLNLTLSNAGESFVTYDGFKSDNEWIDIGDTSSTNNNYLGNLCIKGITVDNYSGTIANSDSNNSEKEESSLKNSNYDKATAKFKRIQMESNEQKTYVNIVIEIQGIKVEDLAEEYKHYFYVSSKSDEENIEDSKWLEAGNFEKQSDGTYTLKIEITDETQLANIDTEGAVYIYIKEIATTGTESYTLISDAIELTLNTSELNKQETNDTIVITNDSSTDTTIANKILPNTGYIPVIITIMLVIGIIGIFAYIRYKNIDK